MTRNQKFIAAGIAAATVSLAAVGAIAGRGGDWGHGGWRHHGGGMGYLGGAGFMGPMAGSAAATPARWPTICLCTSSTR